MSLIHWLFGVSGNWNQATNWSSAAAPISSDEATIAAAGIYTVSVSNAAAAGSLTFNAASAILSEGALGSLDIVGAVTLEAGKIILRAANSMGSFTQTGGSLQLYNAAALGSANLTLDGGDLAGMATESLANHLNLGGAEFTIDAATGAALTVGVGGWSLNTASTPTVQFGSAGRAGTVVWMTPSAKIGGGGGYLVNVTDGTLKAGDKSLGFLLRHDKSTTVAAGAAIDLNGFSATINGLQGGGRVENGGAAAALILNSANFFAGVISGPIGVEVATSSSFTGVNTYTRGTTIDSGQSLSLWGDGRLAGAIVDNGGLDIETNGGTITPGVISGSGVVTENTGDGNLVLNHANTYSGGTNLYSGKILLGAAAGLGTGPADLGNGELVGTATETVANAIVFGRIVYGGGITVAAATGKTLTFSGATTWDASSTPALIVNFGDSAHTGTVVFGGNASLVSGGPISVKVAYGTLKASPGYPDHFLDFATKVTVASGAKLDLDGDEINITGLNATGSIINSSSKFASLLTADTSRITSAIAGQILVGASSGALTLTGANTYTGGTLIETGATLNLGTGGATGSIVGNVNDQGAFVVRESGAVKLAGIISGGGSLTQSGTGATTLSGVNSYSGGTTMTHGELIVTNGHALGTGPIAMTGGELLATASQTQTHDLHTGGSVTIAAAHGTTLNLTAANLTMDNGRLYFGEGANDGTIVYRSTGAPSVTDPAHTTAEVRAGTLRAGNSSLSSVLSGVDGTRIDAGASLDAAGRSLNIDSLTGPGALKNSGAATLLTLFGATNFAGEISGKFTEVDVDSTAVLTGNQTFTGTAVIEGGSLTLSGLFAEAVKFNGGGTLILTKPANFTGQVQNFASGSTIDLRNITTGGGATLGFNAATGVLTVRDGTRTDTLHFAAGLVQGNFLAASDGSGGTDISWRMPPPVAASPPAPLRQRFVGAMAAFAATSAGPAAATPPWRGHIASLAAPTAHPA